MKKRPRKPKALKANYLGVALIFERIDSIRTKLKRAEQELDEPSDSLHYRDQLEALVRLEAQADALGVVFQMPRAGLRKWVADMESYYRKLDAVLSAS